MVDITLEINLDDIIDELDDVFKKQVPYVAYKSLNETAYKGSVFLKKMMPPYIEGGPVPFTARGIQYTKAQSKHLLVARIFIPTNQWKYMRWIVDGGTKVWSRSRHGIGKPIYENTKFNKYGNIPGRKKKEGTWRDMLNQQGGDSGAPRGKLGKGQFIGSVRGGKPALWKRLGKGGRKNLQLLVTFDRTAEYGQGRFPFQRLGTKYATKSFPRLFNKYLVETVNKESSRLRAR